MKQSICQSVDTMTDWQATTAHFHILPIQKIPSVFERYTGLYCEYNLIFAILVKSRSSTLKKILNTTPIFSILPSFIQNRQVSNRRINMIHILNKLNIEPTS
eukprot:Selendium_serpulae@DN5502_c0_g1_i1.p1